MRLAVEHVMGSKTVARLGADAYDQDKLCFGTAFRQNNGATNEDKWVGPHNIAIGRPMEASTTIPAVFPWSMRWANQTDEMVDWIILADNATAAATRRLVAYEYNRQTGVLTWKGFVTLTFPTATNFTIRGIRGLYTKHTAGTVAVSGTAVTGTSTTWNTDRASVGNRIGFGSTNPADITTWYQISAIGSDTGITLTTSAGTISAGTAYVIEDLTVAIAATNATTTNGGLFLVKGLSWEAFAPGGTAIPAATTVDRIRAVMWLKSAATVTETTVNGLDVEPDTSKTSRFLWLMNGTTTMQLFKFNVRAALTLTTGADTTAFSLSSGVSAALTGTASQNNNGKAVTTSHGPGSGLLCIYFTTTTRVYRTVALSTITTGMTAFLADTMTEVPPGGTATFLASSLMNSIEYCECNDYFMIANNVTAAPFRQYLTQYQTAGSQFDRVWGCHIAQLNQSTADSSTTPVPTLITGVPYTVWTDWGMTYIATFGTTAANNVIYAVPTGADWEYDPTGYARVIFPRLTLTNANKLVRAYANHKAIMGGDTGKNLGTQCEPLKLYYRTSGISDNSGAWTEVDDSGDMSSVGAVSEIQFCARFRAYGLTMVPSAIHAVGVVYDDISTDTHYQLSVGESSTASKQFAWRFSTAFGGTVPTLRIRLYDAVSGGLLVDDDSVSQADGTWERSTDGVTYGAYATTDKGNETTYIRFTPTSLADNIRVRPVLTQN